MGYDFIAIEAHWQRYWAQQQVFRTPNPGDEGFDPGKPKFYVLDMFPYPSGIGLHVGHPLGYIATDIVARYKRMTGHHVLHPMGYDAFGLPAEQFAVEHGVHPRVTTEGNIANMTRQLKRLGLSYDWDRCLATTDLGYYRWTQWIFLQLYNSWFDEAANKARPIGELEQLLASEQLYIGPEDELIDAGQNEGLDAITGSPVGARKWFELSPAQRCQRIDAKRLAYMGQVPVNWCPALGTVLANEEVTNEGRSERGNHLVFKRPLRQWMLRITAYAQRLLDELELVDWPEPIKMMQRNWIGRSEGAYVDFAIQDREGGVITVFTTRPDTLFGATYMVLAPEHPLVETITTSDQRQAVNAYCTQAAARADVDRQAEVKEKTGVFTGAYVENPVNGQTIPVWIADYVMTGYGTGAIMAVPAHDVRDFEFAVQFGLPMRSVVKPTAKWLKENGSCAMLPSNQEVDVSLLTDRYQKDPASFGLAFVGEGTATNSSNDEISLDGQTTLDAKGHITAWLEGKSLGKAATTYKLRDWLFSRQRYWGEPFPILHGPNGQVLALDESELPVELPDMEDFRPTASDDPNTAPQPPLARAPESWRFVERDGVRYARELNTMPQWAGSCWYYLRFLDPHNGDRFVGTDVESYWMAGPNGGGVDLYVGGAEHAVLHLLYARFWHKVLYDLGHVSTPEPFGRLFNQGYIQAHAYTDSRGMHVPADEIQEDNGHFVHHGQPVRQQLGKMGKSLKNAIAPDEVCQQYGCDTLRLYEMYLGPLDQSKLWRTRDIIGVHRFLQRLWRNFVDDQTDRLLVTDDPADGNLWRKLHKTIKRVTDAMEAMAFNVAIAALIELNNELVALDGLPRRLAEPMVLCLAPLAPHIAEELWHRMGHRQSLSGEAWPSYDPALLVEAQIDYPVQINGKLKGRIRVNADADDKAVEAVALSDDKVKSCLDGRTVCKVIVIKGRMVNIVAQG